MCLSFGVCCIFTLSTCGSTVTRNCSYVRNPGFPASLDGAGQSSCDFTVSKCSRDVCFLRLDLGTFTLEGPPDATEGAGGACTVDAFDVAGGATPVPTVCGENAGQHS